MELSATTVMNLNKPHFDKNNYILYISCLCLIPTLQILSQIINTHYFFI